MLPDSSNISLHSKEARLGHGPFDSWVRAEFDWTPRTAYRFIQVVEHFQSCDKLSQLAPSALYLLAAPSTPEAVRLEAIERADVSNATFGITKTPRC